MTVRNITLRSQANGLSKTSSTPEPEPPGTPSIHQLKNELTQMLESTMGDSRDDLTLLDIGTSDKLASASPRPISSASSSVTAQNEMEGEDTPVEQRGEERFKKDQHEDENIEMEEFYYVSNKVRKYHSILLQASDALSLDADACRNHCYTLLSCKNVPRAVTCGSLYLLAECSNSDGRRQEAKGFLEQALLLCDDMDRINEERGVTSEMVPHERVRALRGQLSTISRAIKTSKIVTVVSNHTTPSSSRASSRCVETRGGVVGSYVTIHDQPNAETDSWSSDARFSAARHSCGEEGENAVAKMRVDKCHISELEFELTRAREEESRAKRKVHRARRRREVVEEQLVQMRKLWELQKV